MKNQTLLRQCILAVKICTLLGFCSATTAYAAAEYTGQNQVVTDLSVINTTVEVFFEPGYTNKQYCANSSKNKVVINQNTDQDAALYTTLLSASISQKPVGFILNGCLNGLPQLEGIKLNFSN